MSASSETDGPEGTERAGAELAATLRPGDVVLVSGELGSGKTTFVRGALRALGVTRPVTSPTFVVGHLHEGREGPVAHLDLYRLEGLEAEDPGLLDPFFTPETIVFVEWPEQAERSDDERRGGGKRSARGGNAWPRGRVAARVRLAHLGGDRRSVEVER